MSIDELPEMLTVEETAAVLRIGRSAANAEVARFEATGGRYGIPCVRIGRTLRVSKRALLRRIGEQVGDGIAHPTDAA